MKQDLLTLCTYPFAYQADLARHALRSEGIPAYVGDVNFVTMFWYLTIAVWGTKVFVCRSDKDQALLFLRQHPGLLGKESPGEEGSIESRCLACGSMMASDLESCNACGWTYLPSNDDADDQNLTSIKLPSFIRRLLALFNPEPDDRDPPAS